MPRWMKRFDGHTAVLGASGMGKGVITTSKINQWLANGGRVYSLFLHKHEYEKCPHIRGQSFRTYDPDELVEAVKKLKAPKEGFIDTLVNIDEGWKWKWEKGKGEDTEGLEYIANAARSHGVEMLVQCQYPYKMDATVRANCDNLICFRSKKRTASWAAAEYDDEFRNAVNLPEGRFIYQHGMDDPVYGTAWYINEADQWVGC